MLYAEKQKIDHAFGYLNHEPLYEYHIEAALQELGKTFNTDQLNQIVRALNHGRTLDETRLIADPYLDAEQMQALNTAFDRGLLYHEVAQLACRYYDHQQITELTQAHVRGLTDEQIRFMGRTESVSSGLYPGAPSTLQAVYKHDQMREIRTAFEQGLSMEQVKAISIPPFPAPYMRQLRENYVKQNAHAQEQTGPKISLTDRLTNIQNRQATQQPISSHEKRRLSPNPILGR